MYNLEWLQRNLPEGISLQYSPEIHSTNSEAIRLIEKELVSDSTLLLTGNQTAGRGRLQRAWVSDPSDSMTFSFVLRDAEKFPATHPALVTLVAGVAVCDAIAAFTGGSLQVKWPNDILLQGKKTCGILTESVFDPPHISGIVVGIGVNVGVNAIPPLDQMRYPATSIETETGEKIIREELLVRILQKLLYWLPLAETQSFRSHYQKHLAFMGESVNIINEVDQSRVAGTCQGITPSGELLLQQADGSLLIATAGEVSLRPA
ncbi:MAG: biotin--[acetyl-CoA-carboxylase] ligase [Anaerolineae bacterium]|nr:biotin--[acetyl-CoA-carboxylase] ligase [Anaerolineae bacterium]